MSGSRTVRFRIPGTLSVMVLDESDAEAMAAMASWDALVAANPLMRFEPHACRACGRRRWLYEREGKPFPPCAEHCEPQHDFLMAHTDVVAAFAGNQFGKSTALTVSALREALPREELPEWLAESKWFDGPTQGWIVVPSEDKIDDSFRPAFVEWCPARALQGGSWGKAFKGDSKTLRFANGSTIQFKTYKQDASTLGGARLHYVGYDEPPPRLHREECLMRLVANDGFEMFAMTPLKVNTGYVRREIWKKRESPYITVVKGSIYDNPTLSARKREMVLGSYTDIWRQAREFGDFVDVGGLIFPDFEACVAAESFPLEQIRELDVVVGIDPGIRNAGFAWVGFDKDLTAYVFNEGLLQDKGTGDYAAFIKAENARLGLDPDRVSYVCDPEARKRGQLTGERVIDALAKEGVYCNVGNNDHETGFDQMRARMRATPRRYFVDPRCTGHRDEADDYAAKEPGEFDDDSRLVPVSSQFHRLDANRYAVLERFWDPQAEQDETRRGLGWRPGSGPPKSFFDQRAPAGAMP